MNKTKIEWADYTWNPITGCLHGCEYCYAHGIAQRLGNRYMPYGNGVNVLNEPFDGERGVDPYPYGFEPTFHKYRLDEPQKVKKPSKIFVASMGDLFGDWVPDEWIEEVFKACKKAPQHTYMFLTKNPKRYYAFRDKCPKNFWLGASAVNQADEKVLFNGDGSFIVTKAHCIADTMAFMPNSFLSIEPLLNDVAMDVDFDFINWVIVGAQTGPGAVPPKPEWVQNIIDQCRYVGVPVFLKNNLNWPEKIQEWPEEMRR